jgi:hypothetical protein
MGHGGSIGLLKELVRSRVAAHSPPRFVFRRATFGFRKDSAKMGCDIEDVESNEYEQKILACI